MGFKFKLPRVTARVTIGLLRLAGCAPSPSRQVCEPQAEVLAPPGPCCPS